MDDAVDPAGMISPPAAPVPAAGRRRRIAARTRLDFWFDAVLLLGFTLAYSYGFTGIAVHEWLGIGLGAALLLHLTLHWDGLYPLTGPFWTQLHFRTADVTLARAAPWARPALATLRGFRCPASTAGAPWRWVTSSELAGHTEG